MERSNRLELHLTEAELETLISAVRTYNGRLTELEFKLRAAWRRSLSQSDYGSVIADLVDIRSRVSIPP
jgi:hypothetical protein